MNRWIYGWLVRLHPKDYRDRFGDELLTLYDDAARSGGRWMVLDLSRSLARKWILGSGLSITDEPTSREHDLWALRSRRQQIEWKYLWTQYLYLAMLEVYDAIAEGHPGHFPIILCLVGLMSYGYFRHRVHTEGEYAWKLRNGRIQGGLVRDSRHNRWDGIALPWFIAIAMFMLLPALLEAGSPIEGSILLGMAGAFVVLGFWLYRLRRRSRQLREQEAELLAAVRDGVVCPADPQH